MNVALNHSNDKKGAPVRTKKSCSERRCLVTGDVKDKSSLIRFVLDPAGQVVPDLASRLPGRGLWVSADRDCLEQATSKNLFSRAAKAKALVSNDLPEQVDDLLKRRCLEYVGLARSAGATVTGLPQIEHGLRDQKISVVLLSCDIGKDSNKKLAYAPTVLSGLTRVELGSALGREHVVAVGLRAQPMTEKLLGEFVRWHGARAQDNVL